MPPPRQTANPLVVILATFGGIAVLVVLTCIGLPLLGQAKRGANKPPQMPKQSSSAQNQQVTETLRDAEIRAAGLDPKLEYPYWPLVFDPNVSFGQGAGVATVEGEIKNHGSRGAQLVRVKFQMLDKSKAIIGEARAYIGELPAGQTWKYKAIWIGDNADVARGPIIDFR
jgi:hypothetical protein